MVYKDIILNSDTLYQMRVVMNVNRVKCSNKAGFSLAVDWIRPRSARLRGRGL